MYHSRALWYQRRGQKGDGVGSGRDEGSSLLVGQKSSHAVASQLDFCVTLPTSSADELRGEWAGVVVG